jgi:hypothetical protein
MKKSIFYSTLFSFLLVAIMASSCKKEPIVIVQPKVFGCTDPTSTNYNPSATDNDGSCKYNGNVIFWTDIQNAGSFITVTLQAQPLYISKWYSSAPVCGSAGCAQYTLPVGTYAYSATSLFYTWSGSVTVTKNFCTTHQLRP